MVPKGLERLLRDGRHQIQPGIAWPQQRWLSAFPSRQVFRTLPAALDRNRVRTACTRVTTGEDGALNAFLVAMAWGYGEVGYGPWRVAQALEDSEAGRKLLDVAVVLDKKGAQAAYRAMGGPSRLKRIGPAFATKFLYFADRGRHDCRALILDRLVANWLRRHTDFQVNPLRWAPATYDAYLDRMHQWARELRVTPDAVELAIFQEMSELRGNQWSRG